MKKLIKNHIPKPIKELIKYFIYKPLINVYNTGFSKTILISYITHPFIKRGINLSHTNYAEAIAMAEVFKELNYNVDIVNYNSKRKLEYKKYDLIIGFGEPLINSFYQNKSRCITIYYGTGMHVCHQNNASLNRLEEVYNKKNVWVLDSIRIVEKTWSIQTTLVDYMIMFGNQVVMESYKQYFHKPIYNIPLSSYEILNLPSNIELINNKNYDGAKRNFIFMSSSGLVHRGLDLLLEIFSENPSLHMHIFASIDNELGFKKAYYNELYNSQNIHVYGFIPLDSETFLTTIKKSAFCLYPSCSEAGAGSVINLMNHGILPIVTDESSIKQNEFVTKIDSISKKAIQNSINLATQIPNKELLENSLKCLKYTRKEHSLESYKQGLLTALQAILGIKNGM